MQSGFMLVADVTEKCTYDAFKKNNFYHLVVKLVKVWCKRKWIGCHGN